MLNYQTLVCFTWKKSYKNRKFKISVPTWNDKLKLPGESNSVSNVQDNYEYIIKKHEAFANNANICKQNQK